jgi:hypothetical protein
MQSFLNIENRFSFNGLLMHIQQYKMGLGIHSTELGRDIAGEDVRAERQKIAAEVRSSYFILSRP